MGWSSRPPRSSTRRWRSTSTSTRPRRTPRTKAPDDAPLRRTAQTLRRILFNIPARVVRSGRRTTLRLPEGFRHTATFQATLDAVYALPPP